MPPSNPLDPSSQIAIDVSGLDVPIRHSHHTAPGQMASDFPSPLTVQNVCSTNSDRFLGWFLTPAGRISIGFGHVTPPRFGAYVSFWFWGPLIQTFICTWVIV